MNMDEKTIIETLQKGERVTLECKKAQSNVPVDAWKTYSAFANTYGGLIFLGVYEDLKEKDITKRFTITGVDDAEKIRKDFWNIANNPEKENVNLLRDETKEKDAPVNAPVKLNKTQSAIVKAIMSNNSITYDSLSTIVGVDRSTITRNIAVLKKKGIVQRVGGDKNGRWKVLIVAATQANKE